MLRKRFEFASLRQHASSGSIHILTSAHRLGVFFSYTVACFDLGKSPLFYFQLHPSVNNLANWDDSKCSVICLWKFNIG